MFGVRCSPLFYVLGGRLSALGRLMGIHMQAIFGPLLTREQARDVDRRAIRELGISGLVLMENAGRGCADLLCSLGIVGRVAIACGRGNNGGDGFVIARHLALRGHAVELLTWGDEAGFSDDAEVNRRIARNLGMSFRNWPLETDAACLTDELERQLSGADWVVDALLGTGVRGNPRRPFDVVIERLNACSARKLAVDIPSGLDCDTGLPGTPTFRADHTATFVGAKVGFANPEAARWLGQLHVLDIGIPARWARPA